MKRNILLIIWVALLFSCKEDDSLNSISVTNIAISQSSLSLVVNGREKLLMIVEPVNADVNDASWIPSDTSIAKISNEGVVTAISKGETTITLKVNGLTAQSYVTVVESPISDLVMPNVDYTYSSDAFLIIRGSGFTENSKLWFFKNDAQNLLKTSYTDEGVLATINELASNYVVISANLIDGWYSLKLEENNTFYNLGNIKCETPVIGEYEYDANKVIWDDIHWRMMKLRGKVKEIIYKETLAPLYAWSDWKLVVTIKFTFNKDGYLIKSEQYDFDEDNPSIVYEYTYNNKNELTNIHSIIYDKTYDKELKYSNHSFYIPTYGYPNEIGRQGFFIDNFEYFTSDYFTSNSEGNNIGWLTKGLLNINEDDECCTIVVDESSNTIKSNSTYNNRNYSSTITYENNFPVSEFITGFASDNTHEINFNFSQSGIPVEIVRKIKLGWKDETWVYSSQFTQNSPFVCLTKFSEKRFVNGNNNEYSKSEDIYTYDANYNLIQRTVDFTAFVDTSYDSYTEFFKYSSYDKNGNWTQRLQYRNEGLEPSNNARLQYIVTRDITYW